MQMELSDKHSFIQTMQFILYLELYEYFQKINRMHFILTPAFSKIFKLCQTPASLFDIPLQLGTWE